MLKKMRRRVILASMLAFSAVILLIAVLVNLANYVMVTGRADQTLSYILQYEAGMPVDSGELPSAPGSPNVIPNRPAAPEEETLPPEPFLALPNMESNFMTRFFIVRFDAQGSVLSVSTDYIASVDEADAVRYAEQVLQSAASRGYLAEYRYAKETVDDATVVIFLNTYMDQQYMNTLRLLTAAVAGGSLLLVFLLVVLFSRRAIRPIERNIRQQKQFITDASHELKTPLTSISTSVDVIALEHGEDEWTDNIRKQTGRMSHLVSELVTLSRLDEEMPLPNKEMFSLSTAAWEISEIYQPQAKAQQKTYSVDIEDNLTLFGDKTAIQQMLSVLLDNALRYSDPSGEIRLSVFWKKSRIHLEVFNTCDLEEPPDVKRLFDRFYRPDRSRSTETGGTGVGLAIAKAVAEAHGGSISASCPSGKIMTILVRL